MQTSAKDKDGAPVSQMKIIALKALKVHKKVLASRSTSINHDDIEFNLNESASSLNSSIKDQQEHQSQNDNDSYVHMIQS